MTLADRARIGTAVLVREMRRSGRSWRTHGLRVVFSGALVAVVLLLAAERMAIQDVPLDQLASLGRDIFYLYVGVQVMLVGLTAPVLAALGLLDEKDDQTLELLAITRMRPWQVLWGKWLSRLLVLSTLVLAGLPILALVSTLGGVGVAEVIAATLNTLVLIVLLGAYAGFFAILSRHVLLPVILAQALWLPLSTLPWLYAAGASGSPRTEVAGHVSPLYSLVSDDWRMVLPAVTLLPLLVTIARLGSPVFRLVTSGGDWVLSPEVWAWERFKLRVLRSVWILAMGTVLVVFGEPVWGRVWPLLWWAWWVLLLWVLGTGWLLVGAWLVDRTESGAGFLPRLGDLLRVFRWRPSEGERPRRLLARVWRNPVAWREIATRAAGPVGPIYALAVALVPAFFLVLGLMEGFGDREVWGVTGALAGIAALSLTVLLATSSGLEERRARTLELLLTTRMGPGRILLGKLAGVAARTLPLLVLASVFLGPALADPRVSMDAGFHVHSPWGASLLGALPGMRLVALLSWTFALWLLLGAGCLAVALRIRPPRLAWPATVVGSFAFYVTPLVAHELVEAEGAAAAALLVWMPFLGDAWGCALGGVPPELVLSTAAMLAASALVLGHVAARLRHWTLR